MVSTYWVLFKGFSGVVGYVSVLVYSGEKISFSIFALSSSWNTIEEVLTTNDLISNSFSSKSS